MKYLLKIVSCSAILIFFSFILMACDTKTNNNQPPDSPAIENPDDENKGDIDMLYIDIKGNKLEIALENNSATQELLKKLQNGNIVVALQKNGDFEQYGDLGFTLPTNNQQLTAECGDVFLYNSRYICLFYSTSSWSYTKLGKITNKSNIEVKRLLSGSNVTITLSLS